MQRSRRLAWSSGLLFLLLFSCGGGSDGSADRDLFLFMSTDSWTGQAVTSDRYYFEGFVSIGDAAGICPVWDSNQTRFYTGITVSWINDTTGESGFAGQTISYGCVFLVGCGCWHMWEAWVPLALGMNGIRIIASDVDGFEDSMSFTVTRL